MIKKHKIKLIIVSIIMLLPVIVVPLIPVIMFVTYWLCVVFTSRNPEDVNQKSKVINVVLWIFPVMSLAIDSVVYISSLGFGANMDVIIRIIMGIMFTAIGYYLPKCKQNSIIGVKVTWTLHNEENWNQTHKFTGKVWMFGGILLIASTFVPLESVTYIMIVIIILMSLIPILYSYIYYRKQLQTGTVTKDDVKRTPMEKKAGRFTMVTVIIVLVIVAICLITGSYSVKFGDTSFTVDAKLWEDTTVNYIDIEKIEYRTEDEQGSRTFGYGTPSLSMGEFENSEFNKYMRYSYNQCEDNIVITVKGKILVINGEDKSGTEELYKELKEHID